MPDAARFELAPSVAAMLRTPRALLIPQDVRIILMQSALQIDALSRRVEALEARHPTTGETACPPSSPP